VASRVSDAVKASLTVELMTFADVAPS